MAIFQNMFSYRIPPRLTKQPWTPRGKDIYTIFKVFGMTRPEIEHATSRTRGGRSSTLPSSKFYPFVSTQKHVVPISLFIE